MTNTTKQEFTPEEANRRLPLVRAIVSDIIQKGAELRVLIENSPAGSEPCEKALRVQYDIKQLIKELEELGCFYKYYEGDVGLVEFPAVIQDIPVFLCWRSDQDEVRFFRGINESINVLKEIPAELYN